MHAAPASSIPKCVEVSKRSPSLMHFRYVPTWGSSGAAAADTYWTPAFQIRREEFFKHHSAAVVQWAHSGDSSSQQLNTAASPLASFTASSGSCQQLLVAVCVCLVCVRARARACVRRGSRNPTTNPAPLQIAPPPRALTAPWNAGSVSPSSSSRCSGVPCARWQIISTRILGRRTAPFLPFLIPNRPPHGVTPRS